MLFDVRTYRCKVGWLKEHMDLYESHGMAVQKKHLGEPLFYGFSESGSVNCYTHIWVYKDAGDREAKRKALFSDPVWLDYMRMSRDLGALLQQDNELMAGASFFSSTVQPI